MHVLIDALNIRWGGGLVVMRRVAEGLVTAGHRATVIVNDPKLSDHWASGDGPEARHVPGAETAFGALRFRHVGWRGLERRFAPDAILSFNYYTPSALPQATYHINTIPYLPFGERRRTVGTVRALVLRQYALAALRRSQLNLFESGYLRGQADAQATIRNPHVAHIGTDAPERTFDRKVDPARPHVVCVTSGAPHKRNDIVLAAFKRFEQAFPQASLSFVGEADYIRQGLGEESRAYAVDNPRIDFTGYVDRECLFALLSKAAMLVTASELESFFMVAIEAMRVGCPVVASDIGSIRESVGENALLFASGDAEKAAEAMIRVASGDGIDTAAAREWSARFDAEECAARIAKLIASEIADEV